MRRPVAIPADHVRFRANLQAERDAATLYTCLAKAERDANVARLYRAMAQSEEEHADFLGR